MGLKNCKRCKKIFNYVNVPYCPDCIKEEEKCFEILREFIKQNQKSDIMEVSLKTGISEKKILNFIKEGKLETTNGLSSVTFECEKCGSPIKNGRYCDECVNEFKDKTNKAFAKRDDKLKSKSEMYTRNLKH